MCRVSVLRNQCGPEAKAYQVGDSEPLTITFIEGGIFGESVAVDLFAELGNWLANALSPYEETSSLRTDDDDINAHSAMIATAPVFPPNTIILHTNLVFIGDCCKREIHRSLPPIHSKASLKWLNGSRDHRVAARETNAQCSGESKNREEHICNCCRTPPQ
ncbi:hypothetical protein T265_00001 [Opisthorchis viverrini]|uniref:Uncharacterized protein n=1 Tax=Opisthorchis viverrini TaxID=6198 RepID=A0A075AJW8_OPIVI|nr:hypothetical protein T265_00001 [Opisthorchis viverrini]KER34109.1 hypothetical protein T265_00001 [Opisthorchis viverrini]